MSEDEETTVRTITTYREVMTTLIQQHRGKVVDSPGDNLLAEFVSVVDAFTEHYEEGITWCEKAVRQEPNDLLARMMMTVVYSLSGQDEKARVEANEVLRIQPKFTIDKFKKKLTYKREEDRKRFLGALRKAGLK